MKVNCYLTFDDGPFSYTSTILNILQAKGIKATFFLTGKSMANSSAKQYMLEKR